MKVAITGGSGVVGLAVARHLVESGHEVRGLARSDMATQTLSSTGVEPVPGDVLDSASLDGLVSGCEVVFHVAGINEMCPAHPEQMWQVNVEGSRNVLAASERGGVRRLVHTSSAVTLGEPEGTVGTESSPHRGFFLSEYERTKTVSERLLLHSESEVEVVSVNPSSVQGPGRSSGTGALFLALARGEVPMLVDTTVSLVDIDDCARGHLLAAERGAPGMRYVLSGPVITMRQALRLLDGFRGRARRPWFIRREVVRGLGEILDMLQVEPDVGFPICAESLRVLLHGHSYDGSLATTELGLQYTPVTETLARTIDWFVAQGLLQGDLG